MSSGDRSSVGVVLSEREQNRQAYHSLVAQVRAQIGVMAALYGGDCAACRRLKDGLNSADAEVRSSNYRNGVVVVKRLVADGAREVSRGQRQYAEQRAAEQAIEQRRLDLVKRKLNLESDERLLRKSIGKLESDMGPTDAHVQFASELTMAQTKQEALSRILTSDAIAAVNQPLKLDTAESILSVADSTLIEARDAHAQGKAAFEKAQQHFNFALDGAKNHQFYASEFQQYETLVDEIKSEVRLPPSDLTPWLNELSVVRGLLIQCSSQSLEEAGRSIQDVRSKLSTIRSEFEASRAAHLDGYDDASAAIRAAHEASVELASVALPDEVSPIMVRLDAAKALIEEYRFEPAKAAALALKDEIEGETARLLPSKTDWFTKLEGMQDRIDQQRELIGELESPHDPKALSLELLELLTGVTQRSTSYADGVAGLDDLLPRLQANSEFLTQRASLGDSLEAWKEDVRAAALRVDTAITTLRAACDAGEAVKDKLAEPYQTQKQALQTEWEQTERRLTIENSEAAVAALAGFNRLADEIDRTASSGEAMDTELQKADWADARAVLTSVEQECNKQLNILSSYGSTQADSERARLTALIASAKAQSTPDEMRDATNLIVGEELKALYALVEREKNNIDQLKIQSLAALDAAEAALLEFENRLKEHSSGIGGLARWVFSANEKSEYKAYVDVLKAELAALKPMVNTVFADLLGDATRSLVALRDNIRDAIDGLRDQDSEGRKVKTSLSALKHTIEAEAKRVRDDAGVKARLKASGEAVAKQMDDLKESLGTELLSDSEKTFAQLKRDADALIVKAAAIAAELVEFNTRADRLDARLTSSEEPVSDFGMVVDQLRGKITAARAAAEKEDGLNTAALILNEVEASLDRSRDGGDLAAMVRQVDSSRNATVQAKAEWDAELLAFNRELYQPYTDALKTKMSPGDRFFAFFGREEKFTEIEKLRKMATDSAAKKDYEMARHQLSLARSRMEFHLKYPEGQNAAVLADVGQIKRRWRGAVDAFRVSLDSTVNAISHRLEEQDESEAGSAVTASAAKLRTVLPGDAFDAIVDGIAASTGDEARRYRESGLAQVRELRSVLSDPRIRVISEHPFESAPRFDGHFTVGKALLDFEKTILLTAGT